MILKVNNLTVKFLSNKQENDVVRKISFQLDKNKILGIVGESGSGKSVTALAILGLLSENATLEGEIFFKINKAIETEPLTENVDATL